MEGHRCSESKHPHLLLLPSLATTAYIWKKAKQKGFRSMLQPGALTLIQRFDGSLNLNVHYHMLFLEGGYYETTSELDQGHKYWWIDPPTDGEIKDMVAVLAYRVIRFLKKRGYLQDDIDSSVPDEDQTQEELLPELQAASVQSRIAMSKRSGHNDVARAGTKSSNKNGRAKKHGSFLWWSQQESNLQQSFRKAPLYPFNYGTPVTSAQLSAAKQRWSSSPSPDWGSFARRSGSRRTT